MMPINDRNRTENIYVEEQVGWIPVILSAVLILFFSAAYFNRWGTNPIPLVGYVVITFILLSFLILFYRLRIEIDQQSIHIIFGIGIVHIRIEFDEILEVNAAKTSWYQGLGIRITSEGMLYNIHGSGSVKILYSKSRNKHTIQLGSANPNSLKEFLLLIKEKNVS